MTVGENIQQWRVARGLSRNALAKLAGTTHTHIGNIEREESSPTVAMLKEIARGLNVGMEKLVEGVDDEKIPQDDPNYVVLSLRVPKERRVIFERLAELEATLFLPEDELATAGLTR